MLGRLIWVVLLLVTWAGHAGAQSIDVAWPTPVRLNEVQAMIPARDVGDPRVTDHFYAFTGLPGDLLITVDSRNLNGDIDVFTAANLRPLLKFTVYAGSSGPITKGLYLRRQEDLILRVEGRSPNDDEAVYRLYFGGAFAPITSGPLAEHEDETQLATGPSAPGKGGSRVSSVGARIEKPRSEVAAAPEPEASPAGPTESDPVMKAPKAVTSTARARRPPPRRTRPAAAKPAAESRSVETTAKDETETPNAGGSETKPPAPDERPVKRGKTARAPVKPPAVPPATPPAEAAGPRLVIETDTGLLVNRSMGDVRRVTVENGQVVVVGKDGSTQRIPLASVVRMTIAP